jgi:hypothetical protein
VSLQKTPPPHGILGFMSIFAIKKSSRDMTLGRFDTSKKAFLEKSDVIIWSVQ